MNVGEEFRDLTKETRGTLENPRQKLERRKTAQLRRRGTLPSCWHPKVFGGWYPNPQMPLADGPCTTRNYSPRFLLFYFLFLLVIATNKWICERESPSDRRGVIGLCPLCRVHHLFFYIPPGLYQSCRLSTLAARLIESPFFFFFFWRPSLSITTTNVSPPPPLLVLMPFSPFPPESGSSLCVCVGARRRETHSSHRPFVFCRRRSSAVFPSVRSSPANPSDIPRLVAFPPFSIIKNPPHLSRSKRATGRQSRASSSSSNAS